MAAPAIGTTIAAISRHTASSRPSSRRNRTRSAVAKAFPPFSIPMPATAD